jgi:hypothetical protein
MTLPRRDPYVWIHLAGLATVPLWLALCLSGLAVGEPVLPPGLELATLAGVGTLPILWMQLQRPFYIFSIPGLAVRPDKLEADRCRCLRLQQTWLSRGLVCLSAIALLGILYWLYQLAPIAANMTPFAAMTRAQGWLIGAVSFLFANLFVQVPATLVPLLLASSSTLAQTPPYESDKILNSFMVIGLRVGAILPDLAPSSTAAPSSVPPPPASAPPASASRVEVAEEPATRSETAMADPEAPAPRVADTTEAPPAGAEILDAIAPDTVHIPDEAAVSPSPAASESLAESAHHPELVAPILDMPPDVHRHAHPDAPVADTQDNPLAVVGETEEHPDAPSKTSTPAAAVTAEDGKDIPDSETPERFCGELSADTTSMAEDEPVSHDDQIVTTAMPLGDVETSTNESSTHGSIHQDAQMPEAHDSDPHTLETETTEAMESLTDIRVTTEKS